MCAHHWVWPLLFNRPSGTVSLHKQKFLHPPPPSRIWRPAVTHTNLLFSRVFFMLIIEGVDIWSENTVFTVPCGHQQKPIYSGPGRGLA
jgi:hypothetical protein